MIESQNRKVLRWLKKGKSLTPLTALQKMGVMRLAARIHFLKERGHIIETTMVKLNGRKVAKYSMRAK